MGYKPTGYKERRNKSTAMQSLVLCSSAADNGSRARNPPLSRSELFLACPAGRRHRALGQRTVGDCRGRSLGRSRAAPALARRDPRCLVAPAMGTGTDRSTA